MDYLRWLFVVPFAVLALYLGTFMTAWRRAIYNITTLAFTMKAFQEGFQPPKPHELPEEAFCRFTPLHVDKQVVWAGGLLFATALLVFIFWTWYWGIAVFIILLVARTVLGYSLFSKDDPYYVMEVQQSLKATHWLMTHEDNDPRQREGVDRRAVLGSRCVYWIAAINQDKRQVEELESFIAILDEAKAPSPGDTRR
jgi:hypothetical protein